VTVRIALSIIGCLGFLFGATRPAAADAVLLAASPSSRALVAPGVSTVQIAFNEVVTAAEITLQGPQGSVDPAGATSDGQVVSIAFDPLTTPGRYEVRYAVISADTDPVDGAYFFTVQDGAPTALPLVVSDLPQPGPSGWTVFAGAAGGLVVLAIGLQTLARSRRLRQLRTSEGVPSTE